MTKDLSHAEHLIQIWARKKYAKHHQDGDRYSIEVEGWTDGYCETCRSDEVGLKIYRYRKNGKVCIRAEVDEMTYVSFPELLTEMLYPLEPVD